MRENITLVRRDKGGGKVLVSLFVPLQGNALESYVTDAPSDVDNDRTLVSGMRRYRRTIKDIREHLKKKLPSYSVPTGTNTFV